MRASADNFQIGPRHGVKQGGTDLTDAAAYFFFTGLLNLKTRGMGPEQLSVFRFSDYGMKSYGNGLVSNPKSMQDSPDAMKAFVKASTHGWLECIADPKAGAAAVKAREPLANEALELERLQLIVDGTMKTPDTKANGLGWMTAEKWQQTTKILLDQGAMKQAIKVDAAFTDKFITAAKPLKR